MVEPMRKSHVAARLPSPFPAFPSFPSVRSFPSTGRSSHGRLSSPSTAAIAFPSVNPGRSDFGWTRLSLPAPARHMNLFFRNKTAESGSSRGQRRRPRLDRRNAAKNYDYDAASTSSSSSSFLDASTSSLGSLHTGSLPSVDPTSFRIHGDEGDQMEMIIRKLGLSGVEDLSIPTAAWESRKVRSSSDLLPRSGLNRLFSPRADEKAENREIAADGAVTEFIDNGIAGLDEKERSREVASVVVLAAELGKIELAESTEYRIRSDVDELQTASETVECPEERLPQSINVKEILIAAESIRDQSTESPRCFTSTTGCGGQKGIRLPELKPPPLIRIPVIDSGLSTWDLFRDLAPAFEPKPEQETVAVNSSVMDRREIEEDEEDDRWSRFQETAVLSSPCSFTTTSNDEDCYSTTSTEPKSNNVSPIEKAKKVITEWEKCVLLGRGSFGSVYEAYSQDGSFFAVKEVSLLDQGPTGKQKILQLEQEIALLSRFEHENIVQYYGTDKDDSNLYIFIELMPRGSLASLYRRYCLKESQVSAYTRQILCGLKYLHEQNVVHRDIKCANILVDASGSVKLADFGLAKATTLNDVKSCKGTAFWMAPEVVKANNHGGYGLPADIWSLGCTVLEMLTCEVPYHPLESMQAVYRIGKGEPPPVPGTLSHDAWNFILKCLQVNPGDRPTAAQLLRHPFVQRPLPTYSLGSGSPGPYYFSRR